MKLTNRLAAAAVLALAAAPLAAQGTISPGMSAEQVRAAFGAPATTRASGDWTYWYYHNGCPVRCGSDDVVFFRQGRVMAAVLRTGARRFTGPRAGEALDGTAEYRREDAGGEPAPEHVIVRGRSRVGGVRVDDPDDEFLPEEEGDTVGEATIIRRDPQGRPLRSAGAAARAEADSLPAEPATQVDDERRAREGRVAPNTVPRQVSPDTTNDKRREREKRVQPRVVPRP